LLLPIGPLEQRYYILIIFSIYFAATPRTRESVATGVVTCVGENDLRKLCPRPAGLTASARAQLRLCGGSFAVVV
jgi:hypothetical protein